MRKKRLVHIEWNAREKKEEITKSCRHDFRGNEKFELNSLTLKTYILFESFNLYKMIIWNLIHFENVNLINAWMSMFFVWKLKVNFSSFITDSIQFFFTISNFHLQNTNCELPNTVIQLKQIFRLRWIKI